MTSCDPAPRDIWLAYDEFADHEGVGKVRPVVILDASGKASVITAKVTTSANYGLSDFVEISDWESCGLRRPSWVQVEPLVEVRRDKLLRDEPLGQLSLSTYELVCAALGSVNQHPLPEPDKPLPGAKGTLLGMHLRKNKRPKTAAEWRSSTPPRPGGSSRGWGGRSRGRAR